MKPVLKLLMALIVPSMLSLASCGKDEPNNPADPNSPDQNGGQSNESIEAIIADNVNASSSYNDYTFTFTISSTLNDKLPTNSIQFGIGHATSSFSEEILVSVGTQAYNYSSSVNGKVETITIKNPFWFYYVFAAPDQSKWTMCEVFYNSYIELKNKGYNRLSSDEKDLYNEAVKYLNDCQKEARLYYRPTINVIINNKYYKVKSYQIP